MGIPAAGAGFAAHAAPTPQGMPAMKSYGGLFDHITDPTNLQLALRRAARGKLHRAPVQRFLANAANELERLRDELVSGRYRPRPYVQFDIKDPKPRRISCADFRDRVVHHALCGVIAPLLERRFVADSFACRIGKGSHRAVLRAQHFTRRFAFAWKADVERFYDRVDHATLLDMTDRIFRERLLRELLRVILEHPFPGQERGKGLPIGNLTSQWLANFYLDRLDHFVMETARVSGYVRYMDDFAAWDGSKERLFSLWGQVRDFLAAGLRLRLKDAATRVIPSSEGLPFLGMRIFPGTLRLQRGRRARMRRLIRRREEEFAGGEIDGEKLAQCVGSSVGLLRFFGMKGLWPCGVEE